jgi:formate hydrogenlyase subunit 4
MLIFLVAISVIAVMVFIEWQYSVMSRRVRAKADRRTEPRVTSRIRRR